MRLQFNTQLFALIFLLISVGSVQAQRVLDLQTCVDIAYQKSLELQNADLNTSLADINIRQAKHAKYPAFNASTTYGLNVGRTIDPTTNNFANQSSTFQTFSLSGGVTLFQGNVLSNSLEQADIRMKAAQYRKDDLKDNIGLLVAQNYLNALLADEATALAKIQIDLTNTQLERIDKLIKAGSIPANDRLELEAQLVRDEQQIIISENNYDLAILNLKNLLLIDINEEIELQSIDPDLIEINDEILTRPIADVFQQSMMYQPSIKADSLDLVATEFDEKISRGRLLPSLSLGGSVSTNYSSLAQKLIGQEAVVNDIPLIINGMTVDVGFPGSNPILGDSPYGSQLSNNLGYGFGLTLSLPIYNNYVSRFNVERAELNIKRQLNQNELNKQSLKATIQNAVAQARAAKQVYLATQKSVDSQAAALENLEKKLKVGSANNFDFISAKNNLSIAQNSLVQAKYDYIFKLKVIDYYLGNPLKL